MNGRAQIVAFIEATLRALSHPGIRLAMSWWEHAGALYIGSSDLALRGDRFSVPEIVPTPALSSNAGVVAPKLSR